MDFWNVAKQRWTLQAAASMWSALSCVSLGISTAWAGGMWRASCEFHQCDLTALSGRMAGFSSLPDNMLSLT